MHLYKLTSISGSLHDNDSLQEFLIKLKLTYILENDKTNVFTK